MTDYDYIGRTVILTEENTVECGELAARIPR